jgi:hypothetical protein
MEDEIEAMGRIGANMKGSGTIDDIELRVVLDAGDTTGILVSKELHNVNFYMRLGEAGCNLNSRSTHRPGVLS